jgi:6-phosphogluconolactonase
VQPQNVLQRELIIGTYTERLPHVDGRAEGILSCTFDGAAIGPVRLLAPATNPSYLALSADHQHLYAVSETVTFNGQAGGGVSAFARDVRTGDLSLLNAKPSGGDAPCHLGLDPTGRFLLVANYVSGSVAVFELQPDGSLGTMTARVQHEGAGTHPDRQTGPHAHMVVFDPHSHPDNAEVLVSDLGLDLVLVYTLSGAGELIEHPARRIEMTAGSGPRHLAFHPDGHHLFVVNELANTLVALRREGNRFVPTAGASTLPEGFGAHSQAAAVRVSPSGNSVLVSNRGDESDSIAVFPFQSSDGSLELAQVQPTSGRQPRELVFDADGRIVVVANQDSHTLVVFAFDEGSSQLTELTRATVPTPVCLTIA